MVARAAPAGARPFIRQPGLALSNQARSPLGERLPRIWRAGPPPPRPAAAAGEAPDPRPQARTSPRGRVRERPPRTAENRGRGRALTPGSADPASRADPGDTLPDRTLPAGHPVRLPVAPGGEPRSPSPSPSPSPPPARIPQRPPCKAHILFPPPPAPVAPEPPHPHSRLGGGGGGGAPLFPGQN